MTEGSRITGKLRSFPKWVFCLLEKKNGFLLIYSLFFAVTSIFISLPMVIFGKSFIWEYDGLEQTYVWFVYTGDWWREVFKSIFVDHSPAIPMFTTNLGYGSDIIATLSSALFDPFHWVSIITPSKWQQFAYDTMAVARVFCAGLAFSAYAFFWESRKSTVLLGSFVYVFSGFMFIIFAQPYLINPMIYFPLILLGLEWIFDRKTPALFIVCVFLAFLLQFFTAYAITLFVIVYAAVRYRQRNGTFFSKRFLCSFLKIAGYFILGVGLSAFVLMPSLYSMLGMERLSLERPWTVFYPWLSYYLDFFSGYLSPNGLVADTYFGFSPLVLILVVVLFLRRKKHKTLVVAFIGFNLCFVLSFCGRILNAFQYPANRWSFVFALFMAYAVIRLLPELKTLSTKEKTYILISCCLYGLIVYLFPNSQQYTGFGFHVSFIVMVILVFLLSFHRLINSESFNIILTLFVIASGIISWGGLMLPFYGEYRLAGQIPIGTALNMHTTGTTAYPLSLLDERLSWRVDTIPGGYPQNSGLLQKLNTVSFYNSISNAWVDKYHTELGLTSTTSLNYRYNTLDRRSSLLALTGVRYYAAWSSTVDNELPFLFREPHGAIQQSMSQDGKKIYETDLSLPLVFAYNSAISVETYESLSMIEKQEALLQGVVCDSFDLPITRLLFLEEAVDIKIAPIRADGSNALISLNTNDSIIIDGDTIIVYEAGAGLRISFDGIKEVETYLLMEGLTSAPLPPVGIKESIVNLISRPQSIYDYSAHCGESNAYLMTFSQYGELAHMFSNKKNYTFHLGYSAEASNEIIFTFRQPGVYHIQDIKVVLLPVEGIEQQVTTIQKDIPRQISISSNEINVATDYSSKKVLFFSIPYSTGWKATIDGKEIAVSRANTAFMAIEVPAGNHHITLRYMTPLLSEGLLVTFGSILIFAVLILIRGAITMQNRKKKRQLELAYLQSHYQHSNDNQQQADELLSSGFLLEE